MVTGGGVHPWQACQQPQESMLLKTADTFEQESARAIDRMLAALVPVITLLLASVVGVVIIAVLVPLYDLTNAIG